MSQFPVLISVPAVPQHISSLSSLVSAVFLCVLYCLSVLVSLTHDFIYADEDCV